MKKKHVPRQPIRKNFKNETGKRYGMLRALRFSHFDKEGCANFVCKCDCGQLKTVWGYNLRSGRAINCGCKPRPKFRRGKLEPGTRVGNWTILKFLGSGPDLGLVSVQFHYAVRCECGKEQRLDSSRLFFDHGLGCTHKLFHGMTNTPEYLAWCAMKQRCFDVKQKSYENYGGRGITVCKRWLGAGGFQNFLVDVGRRPSPELSLDRIEPNQNYEPTNVRWGTKRMQWANRRCVIEQVFAEEEAAYWGDSKSLVDADGNFSVPAEDLNMDF